MIDTEAFELDATEASVSPSRRRSLSLGIAAAGDDAPVLSRLVQLDSAPARITAIACASDEQ